MNPETHHANSNGHGDYERRDVGVAGVLYFLAGLVVAGLVAYFIVSGLYSFLEKRNEAQQTPVSPLLTNAPTDTRRIPPQYKGDYEKYLKEGFPSPQLEVNERTELNDERQREEQILSTYDWVDQNAGTVRIPIERAMELVAQRGLPVRAQTAGADTSAPPSSKPQPEEAKGSKK
jgi:hypothetical protein